MHTANNYAIYLYMEGSSDNANSPRRHRGRPPGTRAFDSLEEKEAFFNHIRYVLVYDKALEYAKAFGGLAKYTSEAEERLRHQQTQARQVILAIIRKPGGIADRIYKQEVQRLSEYRNKTIISDIRTFEDKMYARVYPKYMETMGHAIFWSVAERIYGGRDASDGQQPYVVSNGKMGIRSRESRAYIKLSSLLRSYISTLANQDKVELGLADIATGRFSPPSGQSNWRHNETISIDSKPVTDEGELESLAETLPAPSSEQPEEIFAEFENEITTIFPSELSEHIRGILKELAWNWNYRRIDFKTMPRDDIYNEVAHRLDCYTSYRIPICDQLGDQPDAEYWKDQELLAKLITTITDRIVARQKD